MASVEDGVLTLPGGASCGEAEERAKPWLFASDRPDLTIDAWIARGGGDLLWGILGPTRSQLLGVTARLRSGEVAKFGGRVVKNVAGYDLARAFSGARGELGEVLEAHLRLHPPPRGWRAARREGVPREEAVTGDGCAVWCAGATTRWLRNGEPVPAGCAEIDPLEARRLLREPWREVRSFRREGDGILLASPRLVGSPLPPDEARDPLWERAVRAVGGDSGRGA